MDQGVKPVHNHCGIVCLLEYGVNHAMIGESPNFPWKKSNLCSGVQKTASPLKDCQFYFSNEMHCHRTRREGKP
jgi:hypothetical protein